MTTGAVLSVLLWCWRGAFVAPGSCRVALVTKPTPGTSLGGGTSPSVQPSPRCQKDPAGSSRIGPGDSREGRQAILPAHRQERLCHTCVSLCVPACPCPTGDTELCRHSWTGHSIPSLVQVMLERGGMRGAGREKRGAGRSQLLPCRFADCCSYLVQIIW